MTQQLETDKQLFAARDLFAAFECSPVPQCLIRSDDPVFTIVAASHAYLRLIGMAREMAVGRNLVDALAGRPDLPNLVASLRHVMATQAPERLHSQQITPVLDANGNVANILIVVDEQATDKRFRQLAEISELGVMIGDGAGGISYANPALLKLLGYNQEDIAAGAFRWDKITPPDCLALDEQAKQQVRDTGKCAPYEKVYLAKSGRRVPVLVGAALLEPLNGKPDVAAFVMDLTERRQSQRDAFLVRLDDVVRQLVVPDEIVGAAAKMLCEELDADRCSYGTFESDEDTIQVSSEYVRSDTGSILGRYSISQLGSGLKQTLLANLPYVVNDTDRDQIAGGVQVARARAGIRATIAIPLHKAGRLVAVLGVSDCTKPRVWRPEQVELVSLVVNRCWESIERARGGQALHASEQLLRLAQRAARIGSFEWLMKDDRVIWSPELEALYGLPEGGFERKLDAWRQRVVPEDAQLVLSLIESSAANKQSECIYEFRAILPDGKQRWLRGRAQLFYDRAGAVERMVGVNIDIDGEKRAQSDLRESDARLRAIYDGTYEYIGLLSPDGRVLEANRASLEFAGNTLADVRGKLFWDTPWFSPTPGAPDAVRQAVATAAAGESIHFEATLRRPSGECPTFEISLHPIKNDQGEVTLIVPESRDITERKLAEERLRQQWLTFDTALSNSPDLTYTFDLEGRFTYANRKLCQISQRSLHDTVGRTPLELGYPPELGQRILRQLQQVIDTRNGVRDETDFRLPTGEVREYEYLYEPVIDENGQVQAIAGATRDVTERKQAEQHLKRSEMRFRQLFDALPQLVWSSLPDGRDDLFNKQWFEYTGLSYESAGGNGVQIIHPEDLPLALERWTRSLQTGEPYETEYRLRRFDGEYRWFIGRARPVLDEAGKVLRWFGTCTDIHDKKQSETALLKAHKQLEEFSYVASHDLQEPLRMVNIYSQLMLRELASEEGNIGQYATFVRQGVKRMETLLRDLLTFSRAVESEPMPVGEADLEAALEEAKAVLLTRVEESGALIMAEQQLPLVQGDTEQLAHVFQNLISNSLKYRSPERRPEIRISSARSGAEWIISIADNGIGFEQKYAERIFGLFKRLHKDQYPGTGLGLAICQRIVERYGGRIWAEGRPGQGATFFLALLCR